MNSLILKIQKTKNNNFLTLINLNGKLILTRSVEKKAANDLRVTYTRRLISCLKKIQKLKVQFIHLYTKNLTQSIIKHTFNLFKTWNIQIFSYICDLNTPHNGCRYTHKSRKKRKKRKRRKTIDEDLSESESETIIENTTKNTGNITA